MPAKSLGTALGAIVVLVFAAARADAFKLAPHGSRVELAVAERYAGWFERVVLSIARDGIDLFTSPIHEEMTQRAFGCDGPKKECARSDADFASPYVIAGVRWNDDPPFRLEEGAEDQGRCKVAETIRFSTQPRCWVHLFRRAERRARAGETLDGSTHAPLLHRSHFGDLQFIHAMASRQDEVPETTQAHILGWAELTWRIATGELDLETDLRDVPVDNMAVLFRFNQWRVGDFYTLGNPAIRSHVREVAFGSLLHTVQDSFATGHVERKEPNPGELCPWTDRPAPGGIVEFHVYQLQDPHEHSRYDGSDAFDAHFLGTEPDAVSIGRELVLAYQRERKWHDVQPYFACVFRLDSPRPASAGRGLHRPH